MNKDVQHVRELLRITVDALQRAYGLDLDAALTLITDLLLCCTDSAESIYDALGPDTMN